MITLEELRQELQNCGKSLTASNFRDLLDYVDDRFVHVEEDIVSIVEQIEAIIIRLDTAETDIDTLEYDVSVLKSDIIRIDEHLHVHDEAVVSINNMLTNHTGRLNTLDTIVANKVDEAPDNNKKYARYNKS
jgi:chromosome segregation ATPase